MIAVVVAASAVAGGAAAGAPAGWRPADIALTAAFAALAALAGVRARRWTWVVLAGTAAAVAATGPEVAVGVANLGLAIRAGLRRTRRPEAGAVVAGVSVQLLLRVPPGALGGRSGLVTVAALAPLAVSAWQYARRHERRIAWRTAVAFVVVAVAASAPFALAAVLARSHATVGVELAKARLGSAVADDRRGNQAALLEAAAELRAGHRQLRVWWARPALAVPVVGRYARALTTVTGDGRDVAEAAAIALGVVDLDRLRAAEGTSRLQLLRSFADPLEQVAQALERAKGHLDEIDDTPLLAPLRQPVASFARRIDELEPDARLVADAVRALPGILGADGPRRWFVAFTTPAESRGLGGFMGNWAELTTVDGELRLTRAGRVAELNPTATPSGRVLRAPADYVARYGRFSPQDRLQDVPYSPDFPTVASVFEQLYPQAGGAPVDGAMSLDPYALAALLRLTGPIELSTGERIAPDHAADFLLREQYLRYPTEGTRVDALDEASRLAFEKLSADLPSPRRLVEGLAPLVRQGRLMVHSTHRDEQDLFRRVGLDGRFPDRQGGDLAGLVTQNAGNNKIDVFLRRELAYRARFDPSTGAVVATATVRLHNDAPAAGLPHAVIGHAPGIDAPEGTNRTYLSFYSPLRLTKAALDGAPLDLARERELGLQVYSALVDVPAGATVTLTLQLQGAVERSHDYRLTLAAQPLVNPDRVTIDVTPAAGWQASRPGGPRLLVLREDRRVTTALTRR